MHVVTYQFRRGGFTGGWIGWLASPLPWAIIALSFRTALVAREVVVFIWFFKVFTENVCKVQVTQIYNLFYCWVLKRVIKNGTQNAGNTTSETQELKNFRGHAPGHPPFNNPRSVPVSTKYIPFVRHLGYILICGDVSARTSVSQSKTRFYFILNHAQQAIENLLYRLLFFSFEKGP